MAAERIKTNVTSEELLKLIDGDETAKAFAEGGNDSACAARLSEIAPAVIGSERRINGLDIVAAFADPAAGAAAWFKLKEAAKTSPIVAMAVEWMGAGSVHGLDIADARTLAMCDQLTAAGVWTEAERDGVKSLAIIPQTITTADVSDAMTPRRYPELGKGE